jgi:hypothetical protein
LTLDVTIRRVWSPDGLGRPHSVRCRPWTVIVRHELDELVLWTRDGELAAQAEARAEPPRPVCKVTWSPSHQLLAVQE